MTLFFTQRSWDAMPETGAVAWRKMLRVARVPWPVIAAAVWDEVWSAPVPAGFSASMVVTPSA